MKPLDIHPALAAFPEQDESEVCRLALDVKRNGLVNPIVLFEGQLLDGRARLVACERAGVEPRTFEYRGDDAVAFVMQANSGRQLTAGQRALTAARLARAWKSHRVPAGTREVPPGTREDASWRAAHALGVSRRTVFRAERLLDNPALVADVEAGRMKVNEALRQLAPKPLSDQPARNPDGRVAVAAAVDRVERKATALREELRLLCDRPHARAMLEATLLDLARDFYAFAEAPDAREAVPS